MPVLAPFLRSFKKPGVTGWSVFLILLAVVAVLSYQRYVLFNDARTRELTNAALNARDKLKTALNHSVSATNTLGFIISRYDGKKDFGAVAKNLLDSNQYIDALELVEGGVITQVYPVEENKSAIGYDILSDPLVNKEAERAIREDKIFFAGPLLLKQGYTGVVGRLPLFSNGKFWGFAAAIVKLSTLIQAAELENASEKGYVFQLSKKDPNTGKEQFFLDRGDLFRKKDWVAVTVQEGDWKIYARFLKSGTLASLLPFVILGFLFAAFGGVFAWYGARHPYQLQKQVNEKTRQLRESEEKYFSFFENASDTIMVTDSQGVIVEVNRSLCQLLDYPREELLGMNFKQLVDPLQLEAELIADDFTQQG